jgi:hypothetical protein
LIRKEDGALIWVWVSCEGAYCFVYSLQTGGMPTGKCGTDRRQKSFGEVQVRGYGKSTLLCTIAWLEHITDGTLTIGGCVVTEARLAIGRATVCMPEVLLFEAPLSTWSLRR